MMTTEQQRDLGSRLLYFTEATGVEDGSTVFLRNTDGTHFVLTGEQVREIGFVLMSQHTLKNLLGRS